MWSMTTSVGNAANTRSRSGIKSTSIKIWTCHPSVRILFRHLSRRVQLNATAGNEIDAEFTKSTACEVFQLPFACLFVQYRDATEPVGRRNHQIGANSMVRTVDRGMHNHSPLETQLVRQFQIVGCGDGRRLNSRLSATGYRSALPNMCMCASMLFGGNLKRSRLGVASGGRHRGRGALIAFAHHLRPERGEDRE